MRLPETIEVPISILRPEQLAEAQSFVRYKESRLKYAAEDRLREGTASTSEKIRAAWAQYGAKAPFGKYGPRVRVMAPHFPTTVTFGKFACPETVAYETFDFKREVTRNSWGTVTRIHCGGLTVSETVEETR